MFYNIIIYSSLRFNFRVKDIETLETFATFMVADMNPPTQNALRIVTIPPVLDRIKPIWNYCRYALLPCSYINDSKVSLLSRYLVF